MSRDNILSAIKASQPSSSSLPDLHSFSGSQHPVEENFITVLKAIGSEVLKVKNKQEAVTELQKRTLPHQRAVTAIAAFPFGEYIPSTTDGHTLENVFLSIVEGEFGVAENGAIWITETSMSVRALPFICERLAIILPADKIVPTLHEAYEKIGLSDHAFGSFIAGPSKTADIEQSLVLGAHGAKGLLVLLIGEEGLKRIE